MAYTPVPSVAVGDLWTAAENNTYVKDNLAAGVPDIFTTKGDLAVATGADAASRLGAGSNGQHLIANSAQATGLQWVTLFTPTIYTSTSWDGDVKNIGDFDIDLTTVFSLPTGCRAVMVWCAAKWAAAGDGTTLTITHPGYTYKFLLLRSLVANIHHDATAIIPLPANNTIRVSVAGANTTDVVLEIQGYVL